MHINFTSLILFFPQEKVIKIPDVNAYSHGADDVNTGVSLMTLEPLLPSFLVGKKYELLE